MDISRPLLTGEEDHRSPSDYAFNQEHRSRHRLISAMVLPNVDVTTILPEALNDLLTNSGYWIGLINRLGFDTQVYHNSFQPNLDVLSRYFDSTQLGMLRIFHIFDKDNDSQLFFEEIGRGLRQQAMYTMAGTKTADDAFGELCNLLSASQRDSEQRDEREETGGPVIDNRVSTPEFLAVLKNLRLAALLSGQSDDNIRIHLHEYREDSLYSSCPMDHPITFLFKPSGSNSFSFTPPLQTSRFRVRWLHIHDASRIEILGIAMKYGLDPRFVLDVFTLWREQAKADQVSSYEGGIYRADASASGALPFQVGEPSLERPLWFFVVIPVLRLSQASRDSLKPFLSWKRQRMKRIVCSNSGQAFSKGGRGGVTRSPFLLGEENIVDGNSFNSILDEAPFIDVVIEHCNLAMFVSGVAEGGTVISFSSEWVQLMQVSTSRKTRIDEENKRINKGTNSRMTSSSRMNGLDCNDNNVENPAWSSSPHPESEDVAMFSKLLGQIRTSYSRLRTGDAHTWLLKTLCDITEDYIAVSQAFDSFLFVMQKRLDKEKDRLPEKEFRRIQKSLGHFNQLFRLVRPVSNMVDIFSNKQWSGDSLLYVSDIKSNVTRFLDDTKAMKENAKILIDRFHQYCSSKTSSVLYALTLVTTVFVPGQFLTSLYGMNFQDPDTGKPGIPELMWRHGYAIFWFVNIVITVFTFVYYRRQQWI